MSVSGLVPLVILAVVAVAAPSGATAEHAVSAMIAYGAVLLAFLGGTRWGAEVLRAPFAPDTWRLALAALPPVLGWIAVLAMQIPVPALGLLIIAGALHMAWDIRAARAGLLPPWTVRLRAITAGSGMACLAVGLWVAARAAA